MPKLFYDRSQPARCPFCRAELPRPDQVDEDLYAEFAAGTCSCGAVFTHDPTARNGGPALLEALVLACGGDWDRALSLAPGEDYDEGHVMKYDGRTHRVGQAFGTLYVIRLKPHAISQEESPKEQQS